MKRYILFFVSIGILLVSVFVYSTMKVAEEKKIGFSDSGYILNGATERYYFNQDETYTTSYNNKIVFNDTEGEKVTLDDTNFVHYSNGNIGALQDSVLLDLSKITENPITYYNIKANKEVRKISNRYMIRNLDADIQFEQAIWKISSNKYIVLGNNLIIKLNNGTQKAIKGYVEIEYFDNEIVKIYNQELSYQTISSSSYIELEDDIKINLGGKVVSLDGENRMTLEEMVINSDDNITIVDLNTEEDTEKVEEDEKDELESEEETSTEENVSNEQNNVNTGANGISNVQGEGNIQNGNIQNENIQNDNMQSESTQNGSISNEVIEDKIEIEPGEIIYEYIQDNENKVDESVTLAEPIFKLDNLEIMSTGIKGKIQITDDEDLLSKTDETEIKIINNLTGKVVYSISESYGVFNIPLEMQVLIPDTVYTIIASATYTIDQKDYTKNFLNKTFTTPSVGVIASKNAYTNKSLEFNVMFTDEMINSVEATLLDANGNEIPNRKQIIENNGVMQEVIFDGLATDTQYTMKIGKIIYNGIIQEGENWQQLIPSKTLKSKIAINKLNYDINKREGTVKLYIDDIQDANKAIQSYRYIVYKCTQVQNEDGSYRLEYDTNNIAYQRETTNKEITINIGDELSGENIIRGQYYGFKVIALTYDNEKYVEIESPMCGAFILNGVEFPSVRFERIGSDYPPTEIRGWLYIIDNKKTITVDEDNPLFVTYYSDVDEGTTYVKRTSLANDEITTDEQGNEVIKIWVDIGESGSSRKGLKAETTYTLSVYGTLDLKDGNNEYKNTHIGSAIITTAKYDTLTVNMKEIETSSNAFAIELSLEGDKVAKEGLTSLNLMLYEGSGDINVGEYNNWTRTITSDNYGLCTDNTKYHTEVNSLQELLFDNSLIVTPSFIGGGKESNYTEANYQVLVTATIDGTQYSNKIAVTSADDDNEDTGNTIYTDKETNTTYTAAYMIVNGKGTTANVTQQLTEAEAIAIKNSEATAYGLERHNDLAENTVVGYRVRTDFSNTGTLTAKEITYYVWDKNGNPVLTESGDQLVQTLKFTNQEKAPVATFNVDYGTTDTVEADNRTGVLRRGNAYYFSYTITYIDAKGQDLIWPTSESNEEVVYDNKTLKSEIVYANKQEPNFVMYPKTSNENTLVYVYSCKDVDKALNYKEEQKTSLVLTINGSNQNDGIDILVDNQMHEITLNNLYQNVTYGLKYRKNINKGISKEYEQQSLISQLFEGIVQCNNIRIGDIICNDENDPNKIKIILEGNDVRRAAAAVVTFQYGSKEVKTKLLKIEKNDINSINVDIKDLLENPEFKSFIGENINVKVTVYYDDGRIGYALENANEYVTYINPDNNYLILSNGKLLAGDEKSVNIYKSNFTESNATAQLSLKDINSINAGTNGVMIQLLYSPTGLKQNNEIVVQKEIATKMVDEGISHTIKIDQVLLGMKVSKIESNISTAKVETYIFNPLNVHIDEIAIELWHSSNPDEVPNWNECETRIININNMGIFEESGLVPSKFYHMRFKYKVNTEYFYMYDLDTKQVKAEYEFETLATVGINNLEIEYDPISYTNKYINISYGINRQRSTMYEKMRYTFYKNDGITKINLTESNIESSDSNATYQIVDGSLVVSNSKYNTQDEVNSKFERIKVSPSINVLPLGAEYILKISPIVTMNNNEDYEIETITKLFRLNNPSNASVGLKMSRNENAQTQYIRIRTTIKDRDKIIYGSEYGEYELHVYKYKENRGNQVEVDIYSSNINGEKIEDHKFNILENGTNFSVYVQKSDIDYTYNYVAEITLKYDKSNTGEDLENSTVQHILKSISNEEDISIGSVTIVQNGTDCETRFYDSYYNIDKIDKIEYNIGELRNNTNNSGTFEPEWRLENDEQSGIAYYKFIVPFEFANNNTYAIQMNLYSKDLLVEQIDMTFIKKEV